MDTKKPMTATLQVTTKDYGKYVLFDEGRKDADVYPVFASFNLNEVMSKADELKRNGELLTPAIEQVKDPAICWNY